MTTTHRRRTAGLVLAGLGALVLVGCGQSSGSDAQPDAATSATLTTDWCADPAVAADVEEALASHTEGVPQRILVSPDEMKEFGHTDAEIAAQVEEWKKLSPADLAFQQCIRVRQGDPLVDPVPGAPSDQ